MVRENVSTAVATATVSMHLNVIQIESRVLFK